MGSGMSNLDVMPSNPQTTGRVRSLGQSATWRSPPPTPRRVSPNFCASPKPASASRSPATVKWSPISCLRKKNSEDGARHRLPPLTAGANNGVGEPPPRKSCAGGMRAMVVEPFRARRVRGRFLAAARRGIGRLRCRTRPIRPDGAIVPQLWHLEIRNILPAHLGSRHARPARSTPGASHLGRYIRRPARRADSRRRPRSNVLRRGILELACRRNTALATLDKALVQAAAAESMCHCFMRCLEWPPFPTHRHFRPAGTSCTAPALGRTTACVPVASRSGAQASLCGTRWGCRSETSPPSQCCCPLHIHDLRFPPF